MSDIVLNYIACFIYGIAIEERHELPVEIIWHGEK